MSKTNQDERNARIINLYQRGLNGAEIAKEIGTSDSTVYSVLNKNGIYSKGLGLTDEEKVEICNLYLENRWDEIFLKYPNMNKQKVHSLASRLHVGKTTYFWNNEDVELLKQHYGNISTDKIQIMLKDYHSLGAIKTKAEKMGLGKSQKWSEEEIEIFKKYYSTTPKEEFLKMLPNRTYNAIVCKGMNLGIQSYKYLSEKYSDTEKQFIIDNYKTMTDQEIADYLNKPLSGIQEQRRKLGIYYNNITYTGYENISKLFRGHIQKWKDLSSEKCGYKCVLTGSKNYQVHHLYSFNKIIEEVFKELDLSGKLHGQNIEDYTESELYDMVELFKSIHAKHPLGVCINKNIHKLFHCIYGSGGNTEEQWNKFVYDYKNGTYKEQLKIA